MPIFLGHSLLTPLYHQLLLLNKSKSSLPPQKEFFAIIAIMDPSPTLSAMPTSDHLEQPWKAFWPPKVDHLTKAQLDGQPWLTWGPEPDKPDTKPWYDWLSKDPTGNDAGVVCRRGAS